MTKTGIVNKEASGTINLSTKMLQAIAEDFVRKYLETFPLEVFEGLVTTTEILEAALMNLPAEVLGEVKDEMLFDAIRLLGPCGEDDVEWLRRWGGDRIEWTDENRDTFYWTADKVLGGIAPGTFPMITPNTHPKFGKSSLMNGRH